MDIFSISRPQGRAVFAKAREAIDVFKGIALPPPEYMKPERKNTPKTKIVKKGALRMNKNTSAYGWFALQITDIDGLLDHFRDYESIFYVSQNTRRELDLPPIPDKKTRAVELMQTLLHAESVKEDPEDTFLFTLGIETDTMLPAPYDKEYEYSYYPYEYNPDLMCELARYVEGIAELTFLGLAASRNLEMLTKRIYFYEGWFYEKKPDLSWHPPYETDRSRYGYDTEEDAPVEERLETIDKKHKDAGYDMARKVPRPAKKDKKGKAR